MPADSSRPRTPPNAARLASSARSLARKLAMQALYRLQLNECPWQDLIQEFATEEGMDRADREYFRELVQGVHGARQTLDAELARWMDRDPALLDPVEHAVLLIGTFELKNRLEVPYRVVIAEGVGLAKRFGATDGHKFVNAVLDRAARELRTHEQ
jgi:N utilization substance protein B